MVLLDYTKAFDTVDHNLLLAKLHYYGCDEQLLDWFRHYLNNRTQVVQLQGKSSAEAQLYQGVPQGVILSPLLFTIFTVGFPFVLSNTSNYHLYADDSQIYTSFEPSRSSEAIALLNKDLECIA